MADIANLLWPLIEVAGILIAMGIQVQPCCCGSTGGGDGCNCCAGSSNPLPTSVDLTFSGVTQGVHACVNCDDYNTTTFELTGACGWSLLGVPGAPFPCAHHAILTGCNATQHSLLLLQTAGLTTPGGVSASFLGPAPTDDLNVCDCDAIPLTFDSAGEANNQCDWSAATATLTPVCD